MILYIYIYIIFIHTYFSLSAHQLLSICVDTWLFESRSGVISHYVGFSTALHMLHNFLWAHHRRALEVDAASAGLESLRERLWSIGRGRSKLCGGIWRLGVRFYDASLLRRWDKDPLLVTFGHRIFEKALYISLPFGDLTWNYKLKCSSCTSMISLRSHSPC